MLRSARGHYCCHHYYINTGNLYLLYLRAHAGDQALETSDCNWITGSKWVLGSCKRSTCTIVLTELTY